MMKRLVLVLLVISLVPGWLVVGQQQGSLRISELDLAPDVSALWLRVPNGSLAVSERQATLTLGSVSSVAQSFTGGLILVSGSPITTSGTLALTVAGTSGGIPYFSSSSAWASSAALAANALVIGGGAGTAPVTTSTGTGVLTALSVNVGSAGALVTFNGALGTPSSGTVTNLTGTASININGTVGATTPAAGTFTTLTANGNTTLGDASGDSVTANAAAWTFANDTNFVLSGGVNGLSFDTTTLSVDATNDRVGIGTASPVSLLHLAGASGVTAITLNTPGSTKGRLQTITGISDWMAETLNADFNGSAWQLDVTSKDGWFFKLDTRSTSVGSQLNGVWVFRIPNGSNPHTDEYALFGVTNGQIFIGDVPKFAGTNTTGAGSALLGTNCPAGTLTAPYTWVKIVTADGSTAYIPAWK